MLLSSLILLSDKILSFGVKNLHVIICSNLSCDDHISSVTLLHSVIQVPLGGEAITLHRKVLTYSSQGGCFLPAGLHLWKPSSRDIHRLQIDLRCLGQRLIPI